MLYILTAMESPATATVSAECTMESNITWFLETTASFMEFFVLYVIIAVYRHKSLRLLRKRKLFISIYLNRYKSKIFAVLVCRIITCENQ